MARDIHKVKIEIHESLVEEEYKVYCTAYDYGGNFIFHRNIGKLGWRKHVGGLHFTPRLFWDYNILIMEEMIKEIRKLDGLTSSAFVTKRKSNFPKLSKDS